MSGDGFINKGLELIRLRGHPKFYNFTTKLLGTPKLAADQIQKFEKIGAKIGLEPSEVHVALAQTPTNNPGSFPIWLKYLIIIIVIVIASIIGIWALYWGTYPPGTLYDALAPHDFD